LIEKKEGEKIAPVDQQNALEVGWVQLTDVSEKFTGPCNLDRFARFDHYVVSGLFQPLGCSPTRFQGQIPEDIQEQDVRELEYDNYVFSIKLDGVRAWMIAYKGVIYVQDRKGIIRRIGGIESRDSFIADVLITYYPLTTSYYYQLYDVVYDGEKCARKPFYERIQHLRKLPIDKIQLDKVFGSGNKGYVMFTKFFTLDMFTRVIYEEGLLFHNVYRCYDFHASKNVLSWTKHSRSVDLYHTKGCLYSFQYERDGKKVANYDYQGGFSQMIDVSKIRDDCVIECKQDILSRSDKRIFQFVSYKQNKIFPNSTSVVKKVLEDVSNVSWTDLFRRLRRYKYFYGRKIYSLHDEGLGSKEYNIEIRNSKGKVQNFFLYEYAIPDICFWFRPEFFSKYKENKVVDEEGMDTGGDSYVIH